MANSLSVTSSIMDNWVDHMRNHSSSNMSDRPNYYAENPQSLITSSYPIKFSLGSGTQILHDAMTGACASANDEVIIVTCFWAKSEAQETISTTLRRLSDKACAQNRLIQVRICFSSRSLFQKLSQTSSLRGKLYPPSAWAGMGLPAPAEIPGLQLAVKSVFVRPFSVMHPKFILIDRRRALMPSCNVSWENWFEGCVEMEGEAVMKLFDFWKEFWSQGGPLLPPIHGLASDLSPSSSPQMLSQPAEPNSPLIDQILFSKSSVPTTTILLPSPHHVNPQIQSIFSSNHSPPTTPLNTFLLDAFASARETIYIQTPNLTCRPVILALFDALERGVNVHIITSRRLMILEQLVTAGTITEFEVWRLRRRCVKLSKKFANADTDPENFMIAPGILRIGYYCPKEGFMDDPIKSHLKIVVVDAQVVVLGSGNMDRASWYTSQELGVAYLSRDMARDIGESLSEVLDGRVQYVC